MIGQTFPKVFNNDEGYSSWNTPFLIIIKKEGHLSKELWQVFLGPTLFHPEIIRIGVMTRRVNRTRKGIKYVI